MKRIDILLIIVVSLGLPLLMIITAKITLDRYFDMYYSEYQIIIISDKPFSISLIKSIPFLFEIKTETYNNIYSETIILKFSAYDITLYVRPIGNVNNTLRVFIFKNSILFTDSKMINSFWFSDRGI